MTGSSQHGIVQVSCEEGESAKLGHQALSECCLNVAPLAGRGLLDNARVVPAVHLAAAEVRGTGFKGQLVDLSCVAV